MSRGSGHLVYSNQYDLDSIKTHTGMGRGRDLLVDFLRKAFSRDVEFRWLTDIYGFAKTPSWQGPDANAGLPPDDTSSRIFIGTTYRYEQTFLPAITVRATSLNYHPISFNQNSGVVLYEWTRVIDGYGVETIVKLPAAIQYAGAWDTTLEIKVSSKSLEDTIDIVDIVMVSLQHTYRQALQQNGLFIKKMQAGAESAENTNNNSPLYHILISLDCYSEWQRAIPTSSLVERIRYCFDVDVVSTDVPATGLAIEETIELA